MSHYQKRLKGIAFLLSLCLTFEQSGYSASSPQIQSYIDPQEYNLSQPAADDLLPPSLGTIDELWSPEASSEADPAVLLIQDAHGHYEAQKKTAGILDFLQAEGKIGKIFIEGGYARLSAANLEFFEESAFNQQAADALLREAEIGGPEIFLLAEKLRGNSIPAYGAEEPELYFENMRQYQKIIAVKAANTAVLDRIHSGLLSRATHLLTKDGLVIFKEWLRYHSSSADLAAYLQTLEHMAARHLDLDFDNPYTQLQWPMLVRFHSLKTHERRLNSDLDKADRDRLLAWIHSELRNQDISEVIQGSRRLPAEIRGMGYVRELRSFWEDFHALASSKGFKFEDYPALRITEGQKILEEELEAAELFKEMARLQETLLSRLENSPQSKEIIKAGAQFLMLRKLLLLQMTREDLDHLEKSEASLENFLSREGGEFTSALYSMIEEAHRFYETARERDTAMIDMLERLRRQKEGGLVLITGGFHKQGIAEELRRRGISYGIITPHISEPGSTEKYESAMTGQAPVLDFEGSAVRVPNFLNAEASWNDLLAEPNLRRRSGLVSQILAAGKKRGASPRYTSGDEWLRLTVRTANRGIASKTRPSAGMRSELRLIEDQNSGWLLEVLAERRSKDLPAVRLEIQEVLGPDWNLPGLREYLKADVPQLTNRTFSYAMMIWGLGLQEEFIELYEQRSLDTFGSALAVAVSFGWKDSWAGEQINSIVKDLHRLMGRAYRNKSDRSKAGWLIPLWAEKKKVPETEISRRLRELLSASWNLPALRRYVDRELPAYGKGVYISYAEVLYALNLHDEFLKVYTKRRNEFSGSLLQTGRSFGFQRGRAARMLRETLRRIAELKGDKKADELSQRMPRLPELLGLNRKEILRLLYSKEINGSISALLAALEKKTGKKVLWLKNLGYAEALRRLGIKAHYKVLMTERFKAHFGITSSAAKSLGMNAQEFRSLAQSLDLPLDGIFIPRGMLLKILKPEAPLQLKEELLEWLRASDWKNLPELKEKALGGRSSVHPKAVSLSSVLWGLDLEKEYRAEYEKRSAAGVLPRNQIGVSFGFDKTSARRVMESTSRELPAFLEVEEALRAVRRFEIAYLILSRFYPMRKPFKKIHGALERGDIPSAMEAAERDTLPEFSVSDLFLMNNIEEVLGGFWKAAELREKYPEVRFEVERRLGNLNAFLRRSELRAEYERDSRPFLRTFDNAFEAFGFGQFSASDYTAGYPGKSLSTIRGNLGRLVEMGAVDLVRGETPFRDDAVFRIKTFDVSRLQEARFILYQYLNSSDINRIKGLWSLFFEGKTVYTLPAAKDFLLDPKIPESKKATKKIQQLWLHITFDFLHNNFAGAWFQRWALLQFTSNIERRALMKQLRMLQELGLIIEDPKDEWLQLPRLNPETAREISGRLEAYAEEGDFLTLKRDISLLLKEDMSLNRPDRQEKEEGQEISDLFPAAPEVLPGRIKLTLLGVIQAIDKAAAKTNGRPRQRDVMSALGHNNRSILTAFARVNKISVRKLGVWGLNLPKDVKARERLIDETLKEMRSIDPLFAERPVTFDELALELRQLAPDWLEKNLERAGIDFRAKGIFRAAEDSAERREWTDKYLNRLGVIPTPTIRNYFWGRAMSKPLTINAKAAKLLLEERTKWKEKSEQGRIESRYEYVRDLIENAANDYKRLLLAETNQKKKLQAMFRLSVIAPGHSLLKKKLSMAQAMGLVRFFVKDEEFSAVHIVKNDGSLYRSADALFYRQSGDTKTFISMIEAQLGSRMDFPLTWRAANGILTLSSASARSELRAEAGPESHEGEGLIEHFFHVVDPGETGKFLGAEPLTWLIVSVPVAAVIVIALIYQKRREASEDPHEKATAKEANIFLTRYINLSKSQEDLESLRKLRDEQIRDLDRFIKRREASLKDAKQVQYYERAAKEIKRDFRTALFTAHEKELMRRKLDWQLIRNEWPGGLRLPFSRRFNVFRMTYRWRLKAAAFLNYILQSLKRQRGEAPLTESGAEDRAAPMPPADVPADVPLDVPAETAAETAPQPLDETEQDKGKREDPAQEASPGSGAATPAADSPDEDTSSAAADEIRSPADSPIPAETVSSAADQPVISLEEALNDFDRSVQNIALGVARMAAVAKSEENIGRIKSEFAETVKTTMTRIAAFLSAEDAAAFEIEAGKRSYMAAAERAITLALEPYEKHRAALARIGGALNELQRELEPLVDLPETAEETPGAHPSTAAFREILRDLLEPERTKWTERLETLLQEIQKKIYRSQYRRRLESSLDELAAALRKVVEEKIWTPAELQLRAESLAFKMQVNRGRLSAGEKHEWDARAYRLFQVIAEESLEFQRGNAVRELEVKLSRLGETFQEMTRSGTLELNSAANDSISIFNGEVDGSILDDARKTNLKDRARSALILAQDRLGVFAGIMTEARSALSALSENLDRSAAARRVDETNIGLHEDVKAYREAIGMSDLPEPLQAVLRSELDALLEAKRTILREREVKRLDLEKELLRIEADWELKIKSLHLDENALNSSAEAVRLRGLIEDAGFGAEETAEWHAKLSGLSGRSALQSLELERGRISARLSERAAQVKAKLTADIHSLSLFENELENHPSILDLRQEIETSLLSGDERDAWLARIGGIIKELAEEHKRIMENQGAFAAAVLAHSDPFALAERFALQGNDVAVEIIYKTVAQGDSMSLRRITPQNMQAARLLADFYESHGLTGEAAAFLEDFLDWVLLIEREDAAAKVMDDFQRLERSLIFKTHDLAKAYFEAENDDAAEEILYSLRARLERIFSESDALRSDLEYAEINESAEGMLLALADRTGEDGASSREPAIQGIVNRAETDNPDIYAELVRRAEALFSQIFEAVADGSIFPEAVSDHEGLRDLEQLALMSPLSEDQLEKLEAKLAEIKQIPELFYSVYQELETELNTLLDGLENQLPDFHAPEELTASVSLSEWVEKVAASSIPEAWKDELLQKSTYEVVLLGHEVWMAMFDRASRQAADSQKYNGYTEDIALQLAAAKDLHERREYAAAFEAYEKAEEIIIRLSSEGRIPQHIRRYSLSNAVIGKSKTRRFDARRGAARFEEADRIISAAIMEIDPWNPYFNYEKAEVHWWWGDFLKKNKRDAKHQFEAALEEYESYLSRFPEHKHAHKRKFHLLMELGLVKQAMTQMIYIKQSKLFDKKEIDEMEAAFAKRPPGARSELRLSMKEDKLQPETANPSVIAVAMEVARNILRLSDIARFHGVLFAAQPQAEEGDVVFDESGYISELAHLFSGVANAVLSAEILSSLKGKELDVFLGVLLRGAEAARYRGPGTIYFGGVHAPEVKETLYLRDVFKESPLASRVIKLRPLDEMIIAANVLPSAVSVSIARKPNENDILSDAVPGFLMLQSADLLKLQPSDRVQYAVRLLQLQLLAAETLKDDLSGATPFEARKAVAAFLERAGIQYDQGPQGFFRPSVQSLLSDALSRAIAAHRATARAA